MVFVEFEGKNGNVLIMLTVLHPQELTPMEGLDHLFLLPQRVLTMDTLTLQKDLAGLDFNARLLHEAPMGNVWLCKSKINTQFKLFNRHICPVI